MNAVSAFRRHPVALIAAVGAVLAAVFAGCESADSYHISVSPGHATISAGQSVALKASGWNDYLWKLDQDGIGHLSSSKGDSVVFYAASGVTNAKVTVTVTAVGSGNSSDTSTNSNTSASSTSGSAGYTATATIEIQ